MLTCSSVSGFKTKPTWVCRSVRVSFLVHLKQPEEGGSALSAIKMNYVNPRFSASAKCADDVTKRGIIALLTINIPG